MIGFMIPLDAYQNPIYLAKKYNKINDLFWLTVYHYLL